MSAVVRFWLWISVFVSIFVGVIFLIWTVLRVSNLQKQIQKSVFYNSRPNKGVISLTEYAQIRPFLSEVHVDLLLNLAYEYKWQNLKFLVSAELFEVYELERQLKITPQVRGTNNALEEKKVQHISAVFKKNLSEVSVSWTDEHYDFLFVESLTPEAKILVQKLVPSPKAITFLLAKKFFERRVVRSFLKSQGLRYVKLKNVFGALFVVFHR